MNKITAIFAVVGAFLMGVAITSTVYEVNENDAQGIDHVAVSPEDFFDHPEIVSPGGRQVEIHPTGWCHDQHNQNGSNLNECLDAEWCWGWLNVRMVYGDNRPGDEYRCVGRERFVLDQPIETTEPTEITEAPNWGHQHNHH